MGLIDGEEIISPGSLEFHSKEWNRTIVWQNDGGAE